MSYTVYVDDNYNYMDESARYTLGEFKTYQAAVAAAKKLVDAFLLEHYKPGTTAEELYSGFRGYGEDPFIMGEEPELESERFSAWAYAEQRCKEICNPDLG